MSSTEKITQRKRREGTSSRKIIYDSLDELGLNDDALNFFPTADLVIEVRERRSFRPGFYIVVEASFTATGSNLTRASERDGTGHIRGRRSC